MTQPFPGPNMPMPGPDAYPDSIRHDRADIDETIPVPAGAHTVPVGTRHPAGVPVADPLCGHLPGEGHDDECAYWRGVALGEYPAPDGTYMTPVALPPFDLRALAAQHITAAEQDRRERGAA